MTTLAMIVETKPSRGGLALWFLKLAMASFVLYFFLLFVPFLSAWRTFRVYDGMYMADSLREELNLRIIGKKLSNDELDWNRRRNFFEEPPEPEQTSSDAPGMLLILGGFLLVLLVRRKLR